MELFNLSGKRALITGATHGLGMAMAKALAKAGAHLFINGHSPEKLKRALEEYNKNGYVADGFLFDVTDEAAVSTHLAIMEKDFGPVDIVINNAGIIKRTPLLEMSTPDFKEVLDIDLVAPFIVSKHAAHYMIKRQAGKIINICSMMSELGRNTVGAYAAAKGGLKMLTRNMATEWARYNIQVNAIGPGYFATEQTAPIRVAGHPFNDFIINRTPAGRWGDPADLAGAAIFLSSAASDFVNGQIIFVDGGLLATIGKPANEL
ncbi:MAG: gluconate 5-dehydrogenase [Cyclobacteriaceae bacterium]|nr:gluconate 5-dehydrogenase [Cyclobacteriaceae bacterium]